MGGWSFIGELCKAKLAGIVIVSLLASQARGFFLALLRKARYWWETFVETKVLPPSPLSKELWVLVRS